MRRLSGLHAFKILAELVGPWTLTYAAYVTYVFSMLPYLRSYNLTSLCLALTSTLQLTKPELEL